MTRGSDSMRGEGVQVTRVVTEATLYTGIGTNGRCCAADKDKFSTMEERSGCVGDNGICGQGEIIGAGEDTNSIMLVVVIVTGWVRLVLRTEVLPPLPQAPDWSPLGRFCLTEIVVG